MMIALVQHPKGQSLDRTGVRSIRDPNEIVL
jgi:hypothetical protein